MVRRVLESKTMTTVLLSAITFLLGVSSWFGYRFADNMLTVVTKHEERIDINEKEIAVLQTQVKNGYTGR